MIRKVFGVFGWVLVRIAILVVICSTSAIPGPQHVIHGATVSVTDGDTLSVITDDQQRLIIRLAEIDAPEHDQPFGAWSKQLLAGLTVGQHLTILSHGTDRYGRVLGNVWANGLNINREMVQSGAAWAYRRYLTDTTLLDNESEAQRAQRGLWQANTDEPIQPWKWRLRNRKGN